MTNDFNFQVNLRGVIDLLSDHLYSGPQVYLRELMQNSVDAITARQNREAGHDGLIKMEVVASGDERPPTIVVHDNGIGLTEDEVHQFLATIGQSSKRDGPASDDFIGRFGIGLLSAFVVCDEIVVITRSINADGKTVQWKGRADGTYSLDILDYDFEPGTQVFLRAKRGSWQYFDAEFVRRKARHFGGYLPHRIEVHAEGEIDCVNETPPWVDYSGSPSEREQLMQHGRDVFDVEMLDAIPLRSQAGKVQGIAYVLNHSISLAAKRSDRVYLKNMLLTEQADNLLPSWAFFVKCILNVNDLRPTASRESFYDDENLESARVELGGCLRQYLMDLAEHDQQRLYRIIDLHYRSIKSLAVEDDDFYRMFIDLLPFETSLGSMTLKEYRENNPVIRHVSSLDQFRQISGVAAAQSICIINSGYSYDKELIAKFSDVFPDWTVEEVDATELTQDFAELTLEERESVFDLLKLGEMVLQPFRCGIDIRKFQPAQLPTLFVTNDAGDFMRSVEQAQDEASELWAGVLDEMSSERSITAETQLVLNYNNSLVQKLATTPDRNLIGRALQMLYVQALLLGHRPLNAREMKLLSDGLLGLIEYSIGNNDESGEE
ncbi:MAG: molecular chaperone HtpG [Pirellulaceae bacterium]|jgi:molecular chaperone HtpG